MPLAATVLILLVAAPLTQASADQQRWLPHLNLPVLTADTSKQCCRVCRKGKPCGDGCISTKKQCKAGAGCACSAESGS